MSIIVYMSENLYREVEKWPSRPFHFICADQLYVYMGNIGKEMGTRIISYMFINEDAPVNILYVYIYTCVCVYIQCLCSVHIHSVYLLRSRNNPPINMITEC